MKRFEDLSEAQKKTAVHKALVDIIGGLMTGEVTVKLSRDMHQRVMTNMLDRGRNTGDWNSFHRFVKKVALFKEEVDEMAHNSAGRAYYTEANEYVIYGVAGDTSEIG